MRQGALAERKGEGQIGPSRRCIVTREVHPKGNLLRFVAGPDGRVVPDLAAKLPGRGLWIASRRDILARACATNAFAKAARASLVVPGNLAEQTEAGLLNRGLEALGLAKRAGQLVAGFEKVRAALAGERVAVLVQAVDAAEDGRRKLRALARPDVRVVEAFSAEELGRALGGDAWVHVAVAPGGVAERLVCDAARLQSLRGSP